MQLHLDGNCRDRTVERHTQLVGRTASLAQHGTHATDHANRERTRGAARHALNIERTAQAHQHWRARVSHEGFCYTRVATNRQSRGPRLVRIDQVA